MDSVTGWTGRTACALQAALRLSNEAFAELLGVGVRTVASWHQKPSLRPKSEMQQLLDTAFEQAPEPVRTRFAALSGATDDSAPNDAEERLTADPNIGAALEWLDEHGGWQAGSARREVARRLGQVDVRRLEDRASRRSRVNQREIADALSSYYGDRPDGYGCYATEHAATSILTRPEWLDLDCSLIGTTERLALATSSNETPSLDDEAAGRAAQRLAESLARGTRLVNMPLYRMLSADIHDGQIGGSLGVAPFVHYALTMDLLEAEMTDALAAGEDPAPGSTPLRDRYLPDVASVLDLSGRLCAGGTLALCAFARPADPFRGPADYVLLVQERSGHVINATRKLAVIPKGFHQPMTDYRADARLGATLRREMEEELFGREDIDNTLADQRTADPMHPSRLSDAMRWLFDAPGRLRMECTGFGLNLVSGNFEFAGLIVVEDEEFWARFGGLIEANWESSTLRQYSTLDRSLLTELMSDVAWSNEGLFALLQGLRRLGQIGGDRVDLPMIEWEMR
ncbi:transcriptional regulator [Amycolatopsis alkalitolerans]|uniref:Transcriptional regulator n=1 Tax=Amycolatopsis alkalitolerans TaxID=2547244 RepID=A0A5C4LPI4_9PSEU|nr:transcriptional regulator [Amycolatopsis alkalitolerans]TNC19413.1 transcriptional regulator [Amycolatopsis alkalitolerans]